jgi:hypothetical protein
VGGRINRRKPTTPREGGGTVRVGCHNGGDEGGVPCGVPCGGRNGLCGGLGGRGDRWGSYGGGWLNGGHCGRGGPYLRGARGDRDSTPPPVVSVGAANGVVVVGAAFPEGISVPVAIGIAGTASDPGVMVAPPEPLAAALPDAIFLIGEVGNKD